LGAGCSPKYCETATFHAKNCKTKFERVTTEMAEKTRNREVCRICPDFVVPCGHRADTEVLMGVNNIWNWLRNEDNRKTLAWIGGVLVAIITVAWNVWQAFYRQPNPPPPITPTVTTALAVKVPTNINNSLSVKNRPKNASKSNSQSVTTGDISGNANLTVNQNQ